jgi:hypothetical protein
MVIAKTASLERPANTRCGDVVAAAGQGAEFLDASGGIN